MKGGYGKVDRAIIEDPTLTPESRLIYACLACYADKKRSCYPSIETLIKVSGMSKTRFYKHMDLLVNRGIVEKIKLKNGNLYDRIKGQKITCNLPDLSKVMSMDEEARLMSTVFFRRGEML